MLRSKKAAMHVFASLATVFWALGYVLTRIAVGHFSTEAIAFLRYAIAAVTLGTYAFYKKMRLPLLKDIPSFLAGGAFGFALYVYLINEGSRTLPASGVSFLISASPVMTALFARLFLKEKIGALGWLSIACAFLGIGVITYCNGGFALTSGVIWVCLAAVLISAYNVYQRRLFLRYSPLEVTTYCIVAGALLLSVFAPQSFPQLADASPVEIMALVILGVFSAGMAYLCWANALNRAGNTSEVTNYMFVTPIITTFLGFVLIRESPHISVYAGGMLVLAGVVLINR
jgi:drug/metabolite transporter (DMT)-like permease